MNDSSWDIELSRHPLENFPEDDGNDADDENVDEPGKRPCEGWRVKVEVSERVHFVGGGL